MEAQFLQFDKGFDFSFLRRNKNVFIIHGHNDLDLDNLKIILYELGIKPVVLRDLIDFSALNLVEKLEINAKDCAYAIALCTPDDFISKAGKDYFQVRPNVLFEIGWFCGKFGRKKLLIIKKEGTEIFSDLQGVTFIPYQNNIKETSHSLFKAFKNSKIL